MEKRRAFKRAIMKAKKESWKEFTSQATRMKPHAKLNKIIYRTGRTRIGSVRAGQVNPVTLDDTLRNLIAEHFPGHLPCPESYPPPMTHRQASKTPRHPMFG